MKKYLILKAICNFFVICPILGIAIIYIAVVFFNPKLLVFGIIILSLSFFLNNIARKRAKKLLCDLVKDNSVNFTLLAKATKLFSSVFLDNVHYYDDLEKDLKQNLQKKNKWQGLVSTENLYDYT